MGLKRISLKIKRFIDFYTTPGTKQFGNGTKSAIYAGYSPKRASSQGSVLLADPLVKAEIERIRAENKEKTEKTREEKAEIAWNNYMEAKAASDKRFWWEEHGKLSGHYITKSMVTTEEKKNEEAMAEYEAVKKLMQEAEKAVNGQ